MRYAIINFTRLGDLLQSQSTIAALKAKGHQVSLICLPQFAPAADFIAELDDISIFPGSEVLKAVHTKWLNAYSIVATWLDAYYNKFPFDCVLNLTPSMACRTFASLLSQKCQGKIYGFGLDQYGYNYNSSAWTTYIQAVSIERNCSPFNLIDAFRSMLDLPRSPYQLALPSNLNSPLQAELEKNTFSHNGLIGLQLGASDFIRQWSVENFVELAGLAWARNKFQVVLLGTAKEQDLAEKFALLATQKEIPLINLCGKTSLPELGYVLTKLKALVSNDTGTLHLACGLNVPVLGIYLATAQVWDTGPYNSGQICLEPKLDCHPCSFRNPCPHNYRCHKHISAQTAWYCLEYLIQNFSRTEKAEFNGEEIQEARVWQSFFDKDGFVDYQSLSLENDNRTFWMHCQKVLYKNLIYALENKAERVVIAQEIFKSHDDAQFIGNISSFLARLISLLLLAKEQASMLNLRPSQKAQELLLATIQRLELYLKQEESFKAFLLLWKNFLQENSSDLSQTVNFIATVQTELESFLNMLSNSGSSR